MTNYEQLIALKEALPEKVWPKNVRLIERFPHNGDMEWSFDGRYGGSIEQYCLDIVTAHAERWLRSKGWNRSHCIGMMFGDESSGKDIPILDAIKWQGGHTPPADCV